MYLLSDTSECLVVWYDSAGYESDSPAGKLLPFQTRLQWELY